MTNTSPHFLYVDITNSVKGTKSFISGLSDVLDGTIGFADDTGEFGVYSVFIGGWTWLGTSTPGSAIFQRIQSADLTMINGESLIVMDYINLGSYNLSMSGDAALEIL